MMSSNDPRVIAVSSQGRVFMLSPANHHWEELPYMGLEFKRVSAIENFIWAIGGDHQVYVYVYGYVLPIRVKEEAYENQRWNPMDGFCYKLLPSDRPAFSTEDGKVECNRNSVRLPTMAWKWEDEWHLDAVHDGQMLGPEAWTYAVDFPCTYHHEKHWNSCVRRRKWMRYRLYVALDSWSAVPTIHQDQTKEPFIDVAIGGHQMVGAETGTMAVWSVTVLGRVLRRVNVTRRNPEGDSWEEVGTPQAWEITQLSISPLGLVWAVAWNGRSLVRVGVSRLCLSGEKWVEIPAPNLESQLSSVALSNSAVWAVSRDHRIWFRRGFGGSDVTGLSWLEMVGEMLVVSVSANSQVFAVGAEDNCMYVRQGVSSSDLSGKGWRRLNLPCKPHLSPASSEVSMETSRIVDGMCAVAVEGEGGNEKRLDETEEVQVLREVEEDGSEISLSSAGSLHHLEICEELHGATHEAAVSWVWVDAGACLVNTAQIAAWCVERQASESGLVMEPWRNCLLNQLKERKQREEDSFTNYKKAVERSSWTREGKVRWSYKSFPPLWREGVLRMEWSGTDQSQLDFGLLTVMSVGNNPVVEVSLAEVTCSVCTSENGKPRLSIHAASLASKRTPLMLAFNEDGEMEDWLALISNSCCRLRGILGAPPAGSLWSITTRGDVFVHDLLLEEKEKTLQDKNYEEQDFDGQKPPYVVLLNNGFDVGCSVQIQGTLPIGPDRFMIDLECSSPAIEANTRSITLHLSFRYDQKCVVANSMEKGQWQEEVRVNTLPTADFDLTIHCLDTHYEVTLDGEKLLCFGHRLQPSMVTQLSLYQDVYLQRVRYHFQKLVSPVIELFWRQLGGHFHLVETCTSGVTWALGYNGIPWVHTGGWGGSFPRGIDSSGNGIHPMRDTFCFYIYENQRWNPLTGFAARGLPTDRYMWSDRSGRHECTKENTKLPSMHWQWECDWQIDFHTPGGVDKEGWQYATDFPVSYHGHKGFMDYVRRRRWFRKCRLQTSGPWKKLQNTRLVSVSLWDVKNTTAVWAISSTGDALFRGGVTRDCPEGKTWTAVPNDQPFACISVGGKGQLWAVGKDGAAYLRMGVLPSCPIGSHWLYVGRPSKCDLQQISVGDSVVWAVDVNGSLLYRNEVSPHFPEGTSWKLVNSLSVRQVSVGPGNQVWAILDSIGSEHGVLSGVLCKRAAISSHNETGTVWDIGIGGGWNYICGRGWQENS